MMEAVESFHRYQDRSLLSSSCEEKDELQFHANSRCMSVTADNPSLPYVLATGFCREAQDQYS